MHFYIIVLFPLTAILQLINFTASYFFSLLINAVVLLLSCFSTLSLHITFSFFSMLFSILKHYLDLYVSDTELKVSQSCTVSVLLCVMVLKTISPGCGVRASLMLFLY